MQKRSKRSKRGEVSDSFYGQRMEKRRIEASVAGDERPLAKRPRVEESLADGLPSNLTQSPAKDWSRGRLGTLTPSSQSGFLGMPVPAPAVAQAQAKAHAHAAHKAAKRGDHHAARMHAQAAKNAREMATNPAALQLPVSQSSSQAQSENHVLLQQSYSTVGAETYFFAQTFFRALPWGLRSLYYARPFLHREDEVGEADPFLPEEDAHLLREAERSGRNWGHISSSLNENPPPDRRFRKRSSWQCSQRYQALQRSGKAGESPSASNAEAARYILPASDVSAGSALLYGFPRPNIDSAAPREPLQAGANEAKSSEGDPPPPSPSPSPGPDASRALTESPMDVVGSPPPGTSSQPEDVRNPKVMSRLKEVAAAAHHRPITPRIPGSEDGPSTFTTPHASHTRTLEAKKEFFATTLAAEPPTQLAGVAKLDMLPPLPGIKQEDSSKLAAVLTPLLMVEAMRRENPPSSRTGQQSRAPSSRKGSSAGDERAAAAQWEVSSGNNAEGSQGDCEAFMASSLADFDDMVTTPTGSFAQGETPTKSPPSLATGVHKEEASGEGEEDAQADGEAVEMPMGASGAPSAASPEVKAE
uniref:Myb-like domain-containing protein n=1 Tax=Pinguiococcus pyrenoidosus TaxID=172671 RepID=A0A7R9YDE9_9STRA